MNQHISKAPHLLPRYLRFQCLMFRADPAGGFRENLEIPDHRVLNKRTGPERIAPGRIKTSAGIFFNPAYALENVLYVKQI